MADHGRERRQRMLVRDPLSVPVVGIHERKRSGLDFCHHFVLRAELGRAGASRRHDVDPVAALAQLAHGSLEPLHRSIAAPPALVVIADVLQVSLISL